MASINPVKEPGYCTSLYNQGAKGANWVKRGWSNLTASAGEWLKNIRAAVSAFFAKAAALPREMKIAAVIIAGVTALVTSLFWYCCGGKKEEKPAPDANKKADGNNNQPQPNQPGTVKAEQQQNQANTQQQPNQQTK